MACVLSENCVFEGLTIEGLKNVAKVIQSAEKFSMIKHGDWLVCVCGNLIIQAITIFFNKLNEIPDS